MMLQLSSITKSYGPSAHAVQVLKGISFTLAAGEFCALTGPSGSGKSSLLNIIGLLDRPTSGSMVMAGKQITDLSAVDAAFLRNQLLGFVFQSFQLLPRLRAWENVALPLLYRRVPRDTRRKLALETLGRVGLGPYADHSPKELSGGQQQRVAIARALVSHPKMILADEPTGSLDSHTSAEVFTLLQTLNRETGTTIVMVTHDEALADRCGRKIRILDGRVVSDSVAVAA